MYGLLNKSVQQTITQEIGETLYAIHINCKRKIDK